MIFNSLKVQIIISITGLVLLSFALTTFFSLKKTRSEFSDAIENNALNLLNATTNQVESQYDSIIYHKSIMLSRRKIELKNKVELVFSIITNIYQEYKNGRISENEAKQHTMTEIRMMRYDERVGYFWINNTTRPYPKMIMHPVLPDLEGEDMDTEAYNHGLGGEINIGKAIVNVCLKKGEGFVNYLWQKPTVEGLTKQQQKTSYVKIFKPWNWIIGTGVYIDDIEKDVQDRIDAVIEDLNKTMIKQKTGKSGYFFIFNEKNHILVHPQLAGTDGTKLINPVTKNSLLNEFKKVAFNPEHSMEYLWDKVDSKGEFKFTKKAFISYFKPLGWYIVSSVYKEDFDRKIAKLTNSILMFFSFIFIIIVFISFFVSQNVTNPLKFLIHSIRNTDKNGIPTEFISKSKVSEIEVLSSTINNMINSIKKSRLALLISEMKFRGLVESSSDLIWEVDTTGTYTYISPMVEKILGYTPEEMIGKTSFDLMQQEEAIQMTETFKKILTNKEQIVTLEYTLSHKDGKKVILETSGVPFFNDRGEIIGYRGVDRDVSERKQVENKLLLKTNELSKAYEELTKHKDHLEDLVNERTIELRNILENLKRTQYRLIQSEKMAALGELVAGVAHEINTPVGIGVTAASHLEETANELLKNYTAGKLSRTDFEKFLNTTMESSKIILSNMFRAADLIQSFKNVAVDQSSEDHRQFEIKKYVDEILSSLHPQFKRTHHKIMVDCPVDFTISSYPGAFSQILTNLLMNSLNHAFENIEAGTISIKIQKIAENAKITYRDSGQGISEENLKKIFDPFFTTKRGQGGSGLGMHLAYNLATQTLKGSIQCTSIVGEGTTFELEFPCDLKDEK